MCINSFRNEILEAVINSSMIKENISFKEQLMLYHGLSKLSDDRIIELYSKLFVEDVKPPKPHPMIQRYINIALYIACTVIPIPLLSDLIVYLVNKHSFKCKIRCQKDKKELDKSLCYTKCRVASINWAVKKINEQVKQCRRHNDLEKRKKCRDRLFKLLTTWKHKQTEAKINLKTQEKKSKYSKKKKWYQFRENILEVERYNPPKTNPKIEKMIRMGLVAASAVFAIPGLGMFVTYMLDLNMYKCANRCKREKNKQLCYRKCKYEATKWIVKWIESSVPKCYGSKDPTKCRKKLYTLLKSWRVKMINEKVKYETELHKHRR